MRLATVAAASRWFLCALLIGACAETAPPPANPPRLTFAAALQNAGEVDAGNSMQRDFAFTNRGGSDLTIDKLRAACGCDATLQSERVIPPGGAGRIEFRCDTSTSSGRRRHTLSVYSNDPTTPVIVLRMIGIVRSENSVLPPRFYVGQVHRGERVSRDGILRWRTEPADIVADPTAPFHVEVTPPAADVMQITFSLVMNDDARTGPLNGRLLVRNAAQRVVRTVPVVGEVVADVNVAPARALLEPVSGAPVPAATAVLVQNGGPRSVHVTGAQWSLGSARVETLIDGARYRITLALQQPASADSELIIRTDHPEQPVLRVPVVLASSTRP